MRWLLADVCTRLGFCLAGREPDTFERLVSAGVDEFTDAVMRTEGLAPAEHKPARRQVRAFVAERFETWRQEESLLSG